MNNKTRLYKNYFYSQYKIFDKDRMYKEVEYNYSWYYTLYRFLKISLKRRDSTILELGSGVGGWYKLLKENGFTNYTGLEVDYDMVEYLKSVFPDIDIQKESIEDYKTDKRYDLVFALATLEHMYDPISGVSGLYRIMKKGGEFYALVPTPTCKSVLQDRTHLFCLHPENWKRIFELCGFGDFSYRYISYPLPYLWKIFKKTNIILPFRLPFDFNNLVVMKCKKI